MGNLAKPCITSNTVKYGVRNFVKFVFIPGMVNHNADKLLRLNLL